MSVVFKLIAENYRSNVKMDAKKIMYSECKECMSPVKD